MSFAAPAVEAFPLAVETLSPVEAVAPHWRSVTRRGGTSTRPFYCRESPWRIAVRRGDKDTSHSTRRTMNESTTSLLIEGIPQLAHSNRRTYHPLQLDTIPPV